MLYLRARTALLANRMAMACAIFLLVLVALALFTTVDETFFKSALITALWHSPFALNGTAVLQGPSLAHPFGTDQLGRDVLARMIYGTQVSLEVGVVAVGIAGVSGTVIGLFAGYYGGWFDDLVMRVVDVILAFPGIILALAIAGFLGPGLTNVIVALALPGWVVYARLMRGTVLQIKNQDFVQTIQASGARPTRIVFRHILPNALAPIIVQATLGLGGIIIAEAGLSYLGLGAQPPTPSWGEMLRLGQTYMTTAWWLSVFPGVAILLTVMSFNMLGDTLRDALDPRLLLRAGPAAAEDAAD
jgi:peptide/nickel transport system permease protein